MKYYSNGQVKETGLPGKVYSLYQKNADGTPQRWRVFGNVKRWKRDTDRIQVPIKHGLRSHDYLTNDSLDLVTLA